MYIFIGERARGLRRWIRDDWRGHLDHTPPNQQQPAHRMVGAAGTEAGACQHVIKNVSCVDHKRPQKRPGEESCQIDL